MTTRTTTPIPLVDLEIRIFQRQDEGYPVEVTLGGGQEFPRGYLAVNVLPWVTSGDMMMDGIRLSAALFADGAIQRAWVEARGQAPRRRVRLRIDTDAAELHTLPWELLQEGPIMLSAQCDTPFSRYLPIELPWGGPIQDRPIRVLAVISDPADIETKYGLPRADVALEHDTIASAFAEAHDLEVNFLAPPITLERLEVRLREGYHVLHYLGHGAFSEKRAQTALYMQDEEGLTQLAFDDELAMMLARQSVQPQLIFLAACQTATRLTADAFLGLAPKLVSIGVPAVVAMQDFVTVESALKFSTTFYQRLLRHGQVDLATNEARSTLLTAGRPDAAVPVLFMRLKSGRLWEIARKVEPALPPPPKPTPPPEVSGFVGRAAELAYFGEKLTTLHQAVITGMPGVGKTTLAATLARQVARPDQIFWHTFHDGDGINGLIWKLAGFLFWHGQEELWRMLQGAQHADGRIPPPQVLFDYLVQMLCQEKCLLCLDDFQYIDDDPDDDPLLTQLVERLYRAAPASSMSLTIISQHLPDFVQSDEFQVLTGLSLEDTLAFFARHGLQVPSGEEADSGTLYTSQALLKMEDLMSTDLVANLHARTEGNAQLLTLAVDAFKRTQTPARLLICMFEEGDIERFLMDAIDENLTDDERAAMGAVAVLIGHPGTRDAIEAVLNGLNVRRTLSSLSQRNLLHVSTGELGRIYWMNAVVRHFYYDLLSRQERQAMHCRAGAYYETQEPDALKAAQHFERAGDYEQAAQLATADIWAIINQGQSRSLRALLEQLAPQRVSPESFVRIKLALGQVQTLLGEGDAAAASYQEAISSLSNLPDSSTVRDLKASVCRWMAELYQQQAKYTLALEWVQTGLETLAGQETPDAAELALLAFYVHLRQGDYERALRQAECSLRLGQQLGHVPVLARAHNALGLIHRRREKNAIALEHYYQALDLYQQIGDSIGVAKSRNLIGGALFTMGQWSEAEAYFQQAYGYFDRLRDVHHCIGLHNNLGLIALRQGRLDEALEQYRSGLELLEQTDGSRYLQGLFHASLGEALIRHGDVQVAQRHLQASLTCCQQIEARDFLPELYRLLAEAALFDDDTDGLAEAETQAQRSLDLARELQAQGDEGRSLRVLGEIALARAQFDRAEMYLDQSLTIFVNMGDEYETARGQLSLARLYVAQMDLGIEGKREAALSTLEACTAVLERLEAALELVTARALRAKLNDRG